MAHSVVLHRLQRWVPRAVQEALVKHRTLQERPARISSDLTVERETVMRLERVVQVLDSRARSGTRQHGP
jgi:hypothetical protein